ncbi:cation-translocating P-type ATPase [Kaistella sp. PBT33-4]|uniref:cation-translocating P-type ATPase n=1 Tax=Kaistella sp. PBT33-4 TaxID=3032000 RepID=UPI0023D7CAA1|nr:cation-translocating P-type ATPase [Kaistella sp. PBT33-4]MDF0720656.1 cation-translocating P-type ATPase [Kaistella sp. PBT33-4]
MDMQLPKNLTGLTAEQVAMSRESHGYNSMTAAPKNTWFTILTDILKEPMLILLMLIAVIYLVVGNYGEALFMLAAIVLVSGISFYQDNRSKKALEALQRLNEPLSKVIRNSTVIQIPTHEIVVGDLCIAAEGQMINADGRIVYSHDFTVNEASLTGESFTVSKDNSEADSQVYSGTVAVSGLAVFEVEAVGADTKIGKIGDSLSSITEQKSPLQQQIEKFVKGMAVLGAIVFLLVCAVNWYHTRSFTDSLLNGLTLAMSILPEEIPVAFTTFMALGAWKLMQQGIIIKKSSVVETLGSTTVICTDKTGTITENSMHLKLIYNFNENRTYTEDEFDALGLREIVSYAMWSSEPIPFDPMEKTLHKVYSKTAVIDLRSAYQMYHEYPLEGKPPMMTHVFRNTFGQRIIAAKGAPEALLQVSGLSSADLSSLRKLIDDFGKEGYRVLGVAKSMFAAEEFPQKQQELPFEFLGFVVFQDPPKQGIQEVFKKINDAGIKVKVITGDNAVTTRAIAAQSGIVNAGHYITGEELTGLSENELRRTANDKVLFARMFPEAKLAVVNALKKNGEVVAMLGDGVNDGPALKAAHIGVAMGVKGTEIARAAASLVLTNDDLSKLLIAIAAGRRIYSNIKKAVQYIISIHIPIILTVSMPLFLGWAFPQIFTPVHVIFLELVMGPTCSIVYENEPMEKNTMLRKPRPLRETFLTWRELSISVIQGLVISAGVLSVYQFTYSRGGDEETVRSMVFTTLIFANILLSLSNRSFYYSVFESFRNRNRLLVYVTAATLTVLAAMLYVDEVRTFFRMASLNYEQVLTGLAVAAVSVLWFELYKLTKRLVFTQDKFSAGK